MNNNFSGTPARMISIASLLLGALFIQARQQLQNSSDENELPRWLKGKITKLGPAWIKAGQLISTRPDIFSPTWVLEFSTFQDSVPGFSFLEAKEIIESDLGKPLSELFASIQEEPLFAASIGQIHLCEVVVGSTKVQEVIKVKRPGVRKQIESDLAIMSNLVRLIALLSPALTESYELTEWISVLKDALYEELNYQLEARNEVLFRKLLRPVEGVTVAGVDFGRSGKDVLTLRYEPGSKLANLKREGFSEAEIVEVARILIEAFARQVLESGKFLADPHPGNIAVRRKKDSAIPDHVAGTTQVVLYDYGMVGDVSAEMRALLLSISLAGLSRNAKALVSELVAAGILDRAAVGNRAVQKVFEDFLDQMHTDFSVNGVGDLRQKLAELGVKLRFPKEFVLLGRMVLAMENNLKTLNGLVPSLSIRDLLAEQTTKLVTKTPFEPAKWLHERANELLEEVDSRLPGSTRQTELLLEQERRIQMTISSGLTKMRQTFLFGSFFVSAVLMLDAQRLLPSVALLALAVLFFRQQPARKL
jgi:predicted unusual protein kinase regulating ubiquinone biosynthesis (AarF/ABC1/UbiB family)